MSWRPAAQHDITAAMFTWSHMKCELEADHEFGQNLKVHSVCVMSPQVPALLEDNKSSSSEEEEDDAEEDQQDQREEASIDKKVF